ncbi:uncharacterized protein LOC126907428 [Daktulosphaira vitifoliae]|uniref:uncharacterized protein LOC126907428 n=1 Tax=Daktulosphaira vitifoliae TaxID=58002 RepID=UPI0021A9963E|nr:uncharacterized protein LOC126907428 [Daktulosphaira vitifoliae]
MISLKLYTFSFVLFSVILYTKPKPNLKKNVDQLDKLLSYPGWNNLNDLKFIKYYRKSYYIKNLIQTPTCRYKCDQKICALMLHLNCTYVKVLNNIFPVISNILQKCYKKIINENDFINGCICTEELIDIISLLIVPMAALMKGAIDSLDSIQQYPWKNNSWYYNNYYMMSSAIGEIGNIIDELNELSLSRDDVSTYTWTLSTINNFFLKIEGEINNKAVSYCKFVSFDKDELWKKWVQQYNVNINQGIKLVFVKFLTRKLKDYINTTIIGKYFQLGFKFDPFTEDTFIETLEEHIDIELELKQW